MSKSANETETVIKRILPYLQRRGYEIETDLHFETAASTPERYEAGFVDILVWPNDKTYPKGKPAFLIEAKRIAKKLSEQDKKQALSYARVDGYDVPFVVVCNGAEIRSYNAKTGEPIQWNGKLSSKIPAKSQLKSVLKDFKTDPQAVRIELPGEDGPLDGSSALPFRPSLPLRQLNALFSRCHDAIRKNEKDENHIFDDFSKLLFLKLLEEKADTEEGFNLPYSYTFHELAALPDAKADQVQNAIMDMIKKIRTDKSYGDVLANPIHLKVAKTFLYLVRQLAAVSFTDSTTDSKGAAFEYFVRATLKGKKLGQYFTPRPLVRLMSAIVGQEKIVNALLSGAAAPKVLDPACGTGGFLVYLMGDSLRVANQKLADRAINAATHRELVRKIRQQVFFGSDANEGVACAAKMNMIVAGDGHSNIQPENSLARTAKNWNIQDSDCDFILTNPPFGTSESGALSDKDMGQFEVQTTKGQLLFLQKMVLSARRGGEICTVIDEGVLNTDTAAPIRKWLLSKAKLLAVVRLPDETFRPNKINVRSSVLYLQRMTEEEEEIADDIKYPVAFCDIETFGMDGAGDIARNFDLDTLIDSVGKNILRTGRTRSGKHWSVFDVAVSRIRDDKASRFDVKYWRPGVTNAMKEIVSVGGKTIKELNTIPTARGTSPSADSYVDAADGYALVIKSGSNISRYGELIVGGDYIEKSLFDEYVEKAHTQGRNFNLVRPGDVLVSSTGDGTLGKCCVYRPSTDPITGETVPYAAIAEGHVAIIRVDPDVIWPEYLCDYLRVGFGAQQIERLYTGSTGMIELTPAALDEVVVNLLSGIEEQKKYSEALRKGEAQARSTSEQAASEMSAALDSFRSSTSTLLELTT
ncbi:N-6 DNA methylase [Burkholderia pseudomallei]|uniref:N-6 DNA methylase n=1 Tax=Burkholderia pseudomallei TaxID=28450 RepID=UPI0011079538|nr:N-6 DNA methylase [Burkholderia pseudomallei]MBO2973089.1 N-6 DNA methylase [Burkholderia pseudomallei]MBO3056284.1 N-6 DNA methylase [Burkholderia pseudomallei]MBO7758576.1 N-6 DNA methylase [Burkholderia pseudomallei]MBO7822409.1 N-6 DNA methylase [Burkholderia pseudomallei]MBO7860126.1 N-6 DNA methylase [Burkholderia pseudomallei]